MRIKNYKSDIQEFRAHKNQVRQNLKKQTLRIKFYVDSYHAFKYIKFFAYSVKKIIGKYKHKENFDRVIDTPVGDDYLLPKYSKKLDLIEVNEVVLVEMFVTFLSRISEDLENEWIKGLNKQAKREKYFNEFDLFRYMLPDSSGWNKNKKLSRYEKDQIKVNKDFIEKTKKKDCFYIKWETDFQFFAGGKLPLKKIETEYKRRLPKTPSKIQLDKIKNIRKGILPVGGRQFDSNLYHKFTKYLRSYWRKNKITFAMTRYDWVNSEDMSMFKEKGVDCKVILSMYKDAIKKKYNFPVLVSNDNDYYPILEEINLISKEKKFICLPVILPLVSQRFFAKKLKSSAANTLLGADYYKDKKKISYFIDCFSYGLKNKKHNKDLENALWAIKSIYEDDRYHEEMEQEFLNEMQNEWEGN